MYLSGVCSINHLLSNNSAEFIQLQANETVLIQATDINPNDSVWFVLCQVHSQAQDVTLSETVGIFVIYEKDLLYHSYLFKFSF